MQPSYTFFILALFGATAAPVALASSSQTSDKARAELVAREPVNFGPILKELVKGIAGGVAIPAAVGGINALFGGNSQRRNLDGRGVGSIIGKLVGATDDALSTVIKNGVIAGAATGASQSIRGGILNKIFSRDVESTMMQDDADELERQLEALMTLQQKRTISDFSRFDELFSSAPDRGIKFGTPLKYPFKSPITAFKRDAGKPIGKIGAISVPKAPSEEMIELFKKLIGQPRSLNEID